VTLKGAPLLPLCKFLSLGQLLDYAYLILPNFANFMVASLTAALHSVKFCRRVLSCVLQNPVILHPQYYWPALSDITTYHSLL